MRASATLRRSGWADPSGSSCSSGTDRGSRSRPNRRPGGRHGSHIGLPTDPTTHAANFQSVGLHDDDTDLDPDFTKLSAYGPQADTICGSSGNNMGLCLPNVNTFSKSIESSATVNGIHIGPIQEHSERAYLRQSQIVKKWSILIYLFIVLCTV